MSEQLSPGEYTRLKRKGLSKRTRFIVLERDGFKCRYCGCSSFERKLHIDHIIPVLLGGGNAIDNLLTSCSDCNLGKSYHKLKNKAPVNPKTNWAELCRFLDQRNKEHIEWRKDLEKRFGHLYSDCKLDPSPRRKISIWRKPTGEIICISSV